MHSLKTTKPPSVKLSPVTTFERKAFLQLARHFLQHLRYSHCGVAMAIESLDCHDLEIEISVSEP
jgi:hypothetical protein